MTIFTNWAKRRPTICFYTSLPYVGAKFISGDHPVIPININIGGSLFTQCASPSYTITSLQALMDNPQHGFLLALSPYVMVLIHGHAGGDTVYPPMTLDPSNVKFFNSLIRGQCTRFLIANSPDDIRN